MTKKIEKALENIALDKFLGNIISDDDLLALNDLEDKNVVWNLLINMQSKLSKENNKGKENPNKLVNDIYNMQLLYWAISETSVDDIRKKEFYDSLKKEYRVKSK